MCWKLNWLKNTKKIWVANFFHKIHLKEGQKSTNIELWINSLSIMGPQNEAFEKMVAVDRRSTFWKRWSVHSYNGHVHRAQWWARPRFWGRDRDRDFHFGSHGTETETETFILGFMEPRPRPRLSFWVSWNRDRDRDFEFGSRGIETETETFILGLVESRPRPRLSFWVSWNTDKDLDFCFLCLGKFLARYSLVSWNKRQSWKHHVFLRAQTNKCFNPKEQGKQFINKRTQVIINLFI